MAYEIFSVKLYELDEKIRRLHSRIQMSESAQHSKITDEIQTLRKECEETELMLARELKYSQGRVVSKLSKAYTEIEQIIKKTKAEMYGCCPEQKNGDSMAEEKILLAEYALDFAVQAASRALLLSMEAIDAQMTQQEQESEGNLV